MEFLAYNPNDGGQDTRLNFDNLAVYGPTPAVPEPITAAVTVCGGIFVTAKAARRLMRRLRRREAKAASM